MENAQLITLSRIQTLDRQMNIVANNLANVNTTGFKSENLLFEEYINPTASAEAFEFGDRGLSYVLDDRSVANFATGTIQQTGSQFDVAIQADGFFVVQTPAGERYTRDGSFTLGPNGELTTHDGFPVLGDGGPIRFSPEDRDVTINGDGSIIANSGEIGTLRVVTFENPQTLERRGQNLFSGQGAQPQTTPRIAQFALEGANVDAISQISQMIEIQRAYEGIATIMRQQNDLRETAIQRLGQVQVNA